MHMVEEVPSHLVSCPVIGKGAFGTIVTVSGTCHVNDIAIKCVFRHTAEDKDVSCTVLRESLLLSTLARVPHTHVSNMLSLTRHDMWVCMSFSRADCDMRHALNNGWSFNIRHIMLGIARGVEHCHRLHIMHRDIKASNILLFGDVPRITDFGCATLIRRHGRTYSLDVGCVPYRSPELLLLRTDYDERVDVWAMGLLFAQLCGATDSRMLTGHDNQEAMVNVVRLLGYERMRPLEKYDWSSHSSCGPTVKTWTGVPMLVRPISVEAEIASLALNPVLERRCSAAHVRKYVEQSLSTNLPLRRTWCPHGCPTDTTIRCRRAAAMNSIQHVTEKYNHETETCVLCAHILEAFFSRHAGEPTSSYELTGVAALNMATKLTTSSSPDVNSYRSICGTLTCQEIVDAELRVFDVVHAHVRLEVVRIHDGVLRALPDDMHSIGTLALRACVLCDSVQISFPSTVATCVAVVNEKTCHPAYNDVRAAMARMRSAASNAPLRLA